MRIFIATLSMYTITVNTNQNLARRLSQQNKYVIEEYIQQEVEQGNILGPGTAPKVHINKFGAIPKKHQPGKWRLITDLSFPEGKSMNDAIDTKLCSLEYITVDNMTDVAMSLGVGALIAKIDSIASSWSALQIRNGWVAMAR